MSTLQGVPVLKPVRPSTPTGPRVWFSAMRYLAGKALTILVAIFLAVLITMVIVDVPADFGGGLKMSPFQMRLENQIYRVLDISADQGLIRTDAWGNPNRAEAAALERKLRSSTGLDLPYLPRYLLWTYKALAFNWGELDLDYLSQLDTNQSRGKVPQTNIVLQHLPNTLLLVGTAYLLVFLIGMPFSLYLARHYGSWLDRALSVLSPISSVPSWVFAMLLVTIFAVQLRWLPVTGMFDFHKPTELIPYVVDLLKHMILPVFALMLSLLFQLVYTWRTFFIIYSEEDYVDLARAKGLDNRLLEKRYILRPALPYVLTSLATSLIGFWQLTVALERVFAWPGIGTLYLDVLPDFRGENMQIGDLMIVVQIVVTFAYLLGILAILLDLAYVFLDPRIHLISASNTARTKTWTIASPALWLRLFTWRKRRGPERAKPAADPMPKRSFSLDRVLRDLRHSAREFRGRVGFFVDQLRLYPMAIFGLTVIILLLTGSLYTLIALPYEQIGMDYNQNRVRGRNLIPRVAAPAWMNLFSLPPNLSRLIMDEQSPDVPVTTETLENGWVQKTVTYQFDYYYKEIPSDVFLYLDSEYEEKIPFISFEWTTPEGNTINLRAKAMGGEDSYDMQAGVDYRRLLLQNPNWKNWFVTQGQYPTPAYQLLFAKPSSNEPVPQHGTYQLKVTSLLFEEASDVQSQLVILGQVYGVAGTDYWRRDLIVPLLWGMPLSLMIGFLGTFITTLIAMLLPAIGVWFGGWLDTAIQRLTEINMVLPGLAIASIVYALHGVNIWIILAVVVVLNALGAPIKSFRSAFLQAKEAPYIEMARSYGASDFRIITRYLIPRILPVLIPYLVMQIPTFIFLEATLGFFRIRSIYPSWGRIIYEGLSQGALYGSPFWVLQPIFLLLLTGLAFAMLGLALERILNPRVIADIPAASRQPKSEAEEIERRQRNAAQAKFYRRLLAGAMVIFLAAAIFVPTGQGKTLASIFISYLDPSRAVDTRIRNFEPTQTPRPELTASTTSVPLDSTSTQPFATLIPEVTSSPTKVETDTPASTEPPPTPIPTSTRQATYTLQKGEYPYCIARRLNVDPGELLALNGLLNQQTFYAGTVLQIPQSGNAYPGERMQQAHPTTYTVSRADETLYTIACAFGDVDPQELAQANGLSIDSALYVGQQLNVR
jgi:peptide/nickel transport system permease protein